MKLCEIIGFLPCNPNFSQLRWISKWAVASTFFVCVCLTVKMEIVFRSVCHQSEKEVKEGRKEGDANLVQLVQSRLDVNKAQSNLSNTQNAGSF